MFISDVFFVALNAFPGALHVYLQTFKNISQSPSLTGLQNLLCTHTRSFVSKNQAGW